MVQQEQSAYTGVDVLETLEGAVNYNRYLCDLVLKHSRPTDRIIDFGAGMGTLSGMVQDRDRRVACIEIDDSLRSQLLAAGFETFPSIGDVASVSVDIIYSFNVLEHIEDDVATIKGLFDLIKPGGKLILYVPAFEFLMSSFDVRVGHLRRYRLSQIRAIMTQAGFDLREAHYVDCLGVLAGLAYKLLDNGKGELSLKSVAFYDRALFPLSQVFDLVLNPMMGKNVLAIGLKPNSVNAS
jgi:SAM-dependent methyltransferase